MARTEELHFLEGTVFEWDARKATNLLRHGISFAEGASVFADRDGLVIDDPNHSEDEMRFLLVGQSRLRRVLVVVSVERAGGFASSASEKRKERSVGSMKKEDKIEDDEMRPAYDFSTGVKNPYAERFARGSNMVMIRLELFAAFPSEQAVNDALELLLDVGMRATSRGRVPSGKSKQAKAG